MPITTPAAIPALLGPEDEDEDEDDGLEVPVASLAAVAVTVCPPTVTTDGAADVVDVAFPVALELAADVVDDEVTDEGSMFVTSWLKPLRYTL